MHGGALRGLGGALRGDHDPSLQLEVALQLAGHEGVTKAVLLDMGLGHGHHLFGVVGVEQDCKSFDHQCSTGRSMKVGK